VIAKLAEANATLENTEVTEDRATLKGLIPVGRIHAFEAQLPGITHGEGVLLTTFDGYQPITG
jgi:ribosomal protection tetracycline resistance protein